MSLFEGTRQGDVIGNAALRRQNGQYSESMDYGLIQLRTEIRSILVAICGMQMTERSCGLADVDPEFRV